jgi:hypothetical protein
MCIVSVRSLTNWEARCIVSVRSLTNWSWSMCEALKAKCCLLLFWGLNYSGASDRVVMSAIKNLSVCESYRHIGGTFGFFRKCLQAKVCLWPFDFKILFLKFCYFVENHETLFPDRQCHLEAAEALKGSCANPKEILRNGGLAALSYPWH